MINEEYEYQKLVVQNRIVRAATNDYCGELCAVNDRRE